jgi:hypothetical protein
MHVKQQGSPHIVKTGRLDFSQLTWGQSEGKSGRLLKIDQNFNVSFPTTACSPTFHKTNMLHNNDFKRMQLMSQFGIKYWTSSPVWVRFQEHGSSFYVNIKGKVWILVKKNTDLKRLTGRLKLRFLTEIGRFHWNQGEKVTHFAWFGEPWNKVTMTILHTRYRNDVLITNW